jgi:hypothetical protein
MFTVLMFAENGYEESETFPTKAEADAFANGVSTGANFYGAGACSGYVIPGDERELKESESTDEIRRAFADAKLGEPLFLEEV